MQDTLCQLQNETAATNPAAQPQRAANMYYMTKLQIRSGERTRPTTRFETSQREIDRTRPRERLLNAIRAISFDQRVHNARALVYKIRP